MYGARSNVAFRMRYMFNRTETNTEASLDRVVAEHVNKGSRLGYLWTSELTCCLPVVWYVTWAIVQRRERLDSVGPKTSGQTGD